MQPTILIVDDFEEIGEMLRVALEYEGYRVVTASNGKQAIEAASAEAPLLIFIDLYMPGQSGFDTVRLLREGAVGQEVPIIAMTAYGGLGIEEQLRAKVAASGFNDYLSKPLEIPEVMALVKRYVPIS